MNFSNEIFNDYFCKKISKEMLMKEIGIDNKDFLTSLFYEIEKSIEVKAGNRLEDLIYALLIWEENYHDEKMLCKYVNTLNLLLISSWHKQHDNLVFILQKISSSTSMDFMEKAVNLNLEYLSWDENKSFEKKCIRAIYQIGKDKSLNYLQRITTNDNATIRDMAFHEINKLDVK